MAIGLSGNQRYLNSGQTSSGGGAIGLKVDRRYAGGSSGGGVSNLSRGGQALQGVGAVATLANPAVGIGLFVAGSLLSAAGAASTRKRQRREKKKFMKWQNQQRVRGEQESLSRQSRVRSEMGSATRSYFGGSEQETSTPWEGA